MRLTQRAASDPHPIAPVGDTRTHIAGSRATIAAIREHVPNAGVVGGQRGAAMREDSAEDFDRFRTATSRDQHGTKHSRGTKRGGSAVTEFAAHNGKRAMRE